jgi:hypothetical protein
MINELERLRDSLELQQLLSHYAEVGIAVPGEWQERMTHLDGVDARTLPRLHGQLLAYDWIEQNTGHAPSPEGKYGCWYRVTEAGLQALKQVLSGLADTDDVLALIASRAKARESVLRERRARTRKQSVNSPRAPGRKTTWTVAVIGISVFALGTTVYAADHPGQALSIPGSGLLRGRGRANPTSALAPLLTFQQPACTR